MKLFCLAILLFLSSFGGLHAQIGDSSRWFDPTVGARGVIDNSVYRQSVGTGVNYTTILVIPALSYHPPVEVVPQYTLSMPALGAQTRAKESTPLFYVLEMQRSIVLSPVKANFTKLEFSTTSFSKLGE